MKKINAKTSSRKYPILIKPDIIKDAPGLIENNFRDAEKIIFVTNDVLEDLYGDMIKQFLQSVPYQSRMLVIKDGEDQKNLENADLAYSMMIENNMHRNDLVISFGGGVIGDLAGFIASTFHRGLKLLHMPTTIIGQVDSSIGGKVVVNYHGVKNVIGSFYQPHMIIMDTFFLQTLDEHQIINGLSEIVKYGLVFDSRILTMLDTMVETDNKDRLFKLAGYPGFEDIIFRCARTKTKVVEKDEFDTGYRNFLNFGHTVGHAIEKASGLTGISHGRAVAMGMIVANEISFNLGIMNRIFKDKVMALFKKLKLPCCLPVELNTGAVMDALKFDKKFTGASNKFVLLKGINKPAFYYNLQKNIIIDSINNCINNYI